MKQVWYLIITMKIAINLEETSDAKISTTVNICITNIGETKKKVREIDSKVKSILPNPEYKTVQKQMTINEEQVIQQLKRKKTQKYSELKHGTQTENTWKEEWRTRETTRNNRNYQLQNEQPTPSKKQSHHIRYKNNTIQPYHQEVTKNFQATSIYQNGGLKN